MSNILYLHNAEQFPFGKLSPLYKEKLNINGDEVSNVISYCYASLLNKGGRRNAILLENGKEARTDALKYFREEKDQLYYDSLYNGLYEKIKNNLSAKYKLIQSGDSIIIYQSENLYLGVNAVGQGQNIVGNILMKLRIVFEKKFKEDMKRKFLQLVQLANYNIYIVYKSLRDRILNGLDDLSAYIGKMPDEIITTLNLPPFPGKFEETLPGFKYLLNNPTAIAESLRNKYADEYNEKILELKKSEVLRSFLVKNAIQKLPEDYETLYVRYRELKDTLNKRYNPENQEELDKLSIIFRPVVSEINEFIEKLGENVDELKERIYFLASHDILPGISSKIEKPLIVVSDEYTQMLRDKIEKEQEKIIESLREYKKQKVESKDLSEIRERIEKQKQLYKEAEEKFYYSEKKYLKEAAKIAEKEYLLRKGIESDSDSESESESESESDSELEISEKLDRLREKYKKNYKNIYKDIEIQKRYLKNKDEVDKLLDEYNKSIPKRPFIWKKNIGDKNYVLTPSEEVIIDEALNQIVPIKNKKDKTYIIPEIKKSSKDIHKLPVKRGSVMIDKTKGLKSEVNEMKSEEKETLFQSLLKYASKQEDLKELPLLAESLLSGIEKSSKSSSSLYKFSDDNELSPYFLDFIEINHFVFPNTFYYVYFKILEKISPTQENIEIRSYNLLLKDPSLKSDDIFNFKSIEELIRIYDHFEKIYITDKLKNAAEKALYEKFRYRYISNLPKEKLSKACKLLIASYPRELIYNDSDDLILGFSKQNGYNIIGIIMKQIRDNLLSIYGPIRIDEIRDELKERKEIKLSKDISEYVQDKLKEYLYILSIYVDYIKNKKDIKEEDVLFIMDNLYKNCSLKLKKIIQDLKNTPPMPSSFERQCIMILRDFNTTINKSSLQKLWSYIYIINEFYHFEVLDKYIDLFESKNIGSFGKSVYLADVNWFISSINKLKYTLGNFSISLGAKYNIDGKIGSIIINRKNIYEFTDKNLEEYYNTTIMKILTSLETNTESITHIFIKVYETPISVIRQKYIKEKERSCPKLFSISNGKTKLEKENRLNCVFDTFITILNKLKNNNVISENIDDNTLLFINKLLSISTPKGKVIIKNLSTYENKKKQKEELKYSIDDEEDEEEEGDEEEYDELYESLLSHNIKRLFNERGFTISNIDNAVILLKNIAYNPNYNDIMARVLSFSDKENLDLDHDAEEFIKQYKKLLKEDDTLVKKRVVKDEDEEEEEEEEDEVRKKKSKKRVQEDEEDEEDEDDEEDDEDEEGYDIEFDYNDDDYDKEEDDNEDLLFGDD